MQTSDLVYGNTLLSAARTELLGLGATACALRTIRKLSEKTVSEHYSDVDSELNCCLYLPWRRVKGGKLFPVALGVVKTHF